MPASNFLFDLSNLLGKKFDRRAALGTYHVVMAAPVVLVFIARDAIMESNLARQTAAGEKFQRAIHGGESNSRIIFLDQPVQFIDGEVLARFEEGSEYGAALAGLLQSDTFQVLVEDSFRFADVFPRDG
jgi:hypothetical protein